ncbi:MAG: PLP-dependent enzyme glutamate decarboxylase [Actinomycetia bacterium]|nr:PLP-dependent enzyme glutamate decarboxylase [Actinomycetes bacterium]
MSHEHEAQGREPEPAAGAVEVPRVLPEVGRPRDAIFDEMTALAADDRDWRTGRTFGLVFDGGEDVRAVGRDAYVRFMSENALNPMAFPSLGRMHADVVAMTAGLLHHPRPSGDVGFMTAGGTESLLMSVKAARERGRARGVSDPKMVIPTSAHAAFDKGGESFGVEVVRIPVRGDFRADLDATAAAVDHRTVLVAGSAPGYPHGVIDPIPELAAVAAGVDANFHVDACMGGMVLPFMEQLGEPVAPWDFRVPGITSISVDLHKYGYTPKGASVILYAEEARRLDQVFLFDGWSGGFYASPAMLGTRSGGPIAGAWAVLQYVGASGYRELTRVTLDAARRIAVGTRAVDGLDVVGEPDMTLLAIRGAAGSGLDVFAVEDGLKARGWHLDRQSDPESIHATVSRGNVAAVDDFLADLSAAASEAAGHRADNRATTYSSLD